MPTVMAFRTKLAQFRWHLGSLATTWRQQQASLGSAAATSLCLGDVCARLSGERPPGPDHRPVWPAWVPGFRHPAYFRAAGHDANVLQQVLGNRDYDCVGHEPNIRTILDLGGNIGLTSFYFLHRYPATRVVLVEPDAGNLRVARRTLRPFRHQVRFVQAGVWNTPTRLVVERGGYRDGGEWAFQVRPPHSGERADLPGVTISQLLDAHNFERVELLKIDIEAAEEQVFAPEAHPETWLGRVGILAIELHNPRCAEVVRAAVAPFGPIVSEHGELTLFRFAPPAGGAS